MIVSDVSSAPFGLMYADMLQRTSLAVQLITSIFLRSPSQTNLASRKRTYNREKWGFNRAPSSSVGSESDPSSPTTVETDGNGLLPGDERTQDAVADVDANSSVPDHDMNNALPAFTPKPVKLRQDESDVQSAANSNRLSKVLENVKMFEARSVSDTKEPSQKPGTENVSNATFPPRSSVRGKRSSYMEVRADYAFCEVCSMSRSIQIFGATRHRQNILSEHVRSSDEGLEQCYHKNCYSDSRRNVLIRRIFKEKLLKNRFHNA